MMRMRNVLLAILSCSAACTGRFHTELPIQTRNDVLTDYARGESLDAIASKFHLYGREDAREVIHDAMLRVTKRYYGDR